MFARGLRPLRSHRGVGRDGSFHNFLGGLSRSARGGPTQPELRGDAGTNEHAVDVLVNANADPIVAQSAVFDVLDWLWQVIAAPVLDALGHTGPPANREAWPRVAGFG
jgi:hypothetical protein